MSESSSSIRWMLGPFEVFCFPYVKSESSTVKRANRSRHIKRTDPRETFEAAHAFIIALIQAFTGTPDTTPSQIPFMKELIPFYARLLLRVSDLALSEASWANI